MTGDPRVVTLFLGGDVMTGRGVDQVLPHPGDPRLRERFVDDARGYVELAEAGSGPVPRPVGFAWPWGDALPALAEAAPDVRVVNLETSVTRHDDPAAKAVLYRMTPDNVPCLTAAGLDVCTLANNHVLDFGPGGLAETLAVLAGAGIRTAGAGEDSHEAARPAVVPVRGGRVVVASHATPSSGVPASWAATENRPGVAFLPDLSAGSARSVLAQVAGVRGAGDVVVASVHWGSNWGYDVTREQVAFAHRLIDGGVDVVHGHSSHHPRPIEVYRGKLVLYGCGDLVDDYEGIPGYEEYRANLRLLYLASVDQDTGALRRLRMVPMTSRRLRLERAEPDDTRWLRGMLDRVSRRFGTRVDLTPDGVLEVRTAGG